MQVLTAKIAGRRRHNPDHEITPTSVIALERDPENPVDRRAVKVVADDVFVGYLESGLAALIANRLDRGRPVVASALKGDPRSIAVFVPERSDRMEPGPGQTLFRVPSSDGKRDYVYDARRDICACPVGRFIVCRHKREILAANPVAARARRRYAALTAAH